MIDKKVFRSYDIRGTYPDTVNAELAYESGKAFSKFIGAEIVVGRDMRPSSDELFENFTKGITDMGNDVTDIGMCTTPMLNFAVAHKKYKGGAIVTASHNPAEYNGIKLIGEKAVQFNEDEGIKEVKEMVMSGELQPVEQKGRINKYDILSEYIDWVINKVEPLKKMKIVVDCGNGVGGISAHPVFEKLGLEVVELYFDPDGTFPNHEANPAKEENLEDCQKKVIETNADLGVVFDGDGDRAVLIDERGQAHNPGFMLAALADHELKDHPGEKVYYDLRFSKSVAEVIRKAGGVPVKTKVGNPYYKEKLILQGGLMGAEYSGHFMYQENYSLDDGLFSTLKVIYWLGKVGKTLSQFLAPYEQGYFVSGEINIETEDSERIIAGLKREYHDGKQDEMDGITVEYPDWWFNLRASNTEPIVRLNIEASNQRLLDVKKEELKNFIEKG